jgi:hypothetical protein
MAPILVSRPSGKGPENQRWNAALLPDSPRDFKSIQVWHPNVDQRQIWLECGDLLKSIIAAVGGPHVIPDNLDDSG